MKGVRSLVNGENTSQRNGVLSTDSSDFATLSQVKSRHPEMLARKVARN